MAKTEIKYYTDIFIYLKKNTQNKIPKTFNKIKWKQKISKLIQNGN